MSDESAGIDPYDAVLADLYAKRDQIDQAISAIESLRGGAPSTFAGATARGAAGDIRGASQGADGPGALLGLSIADATKKLLAAKRQPLKNPDIATLFKAGGLVLNSKDWTNTIGAVLTRRAETIGDIVKVERGTWGLKEWYPNRSFRKDKEASKPEASKGEAAKADDSWGSEFPASSETTKTT
ncbi:hypothetical protein [Bradyrhizobium sp. CCBAU 11361]|uniref:hypothetical protein n=1 Tax=Bradyrhizobium sp. CCBAU 11361 TaxID=1630812 RepID=UPI0023051F79|nr:hypothetical protein [Bradyrhizobium sp. CCBAU 11361]